MAFNAPPRLPGSDEYFDALTDASLADADAKREERAGRMANAECLRQQAATHRERAALLAPKSASEEEDGK